MNYILTLLFSVSLFAQTKGNIAVISAEIVNVVYRGIDNPIKIAVPGIPSDKIKVSAPGIKKDEGEGNYILTPGAGNEVKVMVTYPGKDTIIVEEKIFRIKGLPGPSSTLYGNEGYMKLTKQELINAVVKVELMDFLFDVKFEVLNFRFNLPNGKEIEVEGNRMSEDAIKAIMKLKNKQEVIIDNINYIKNNPQTGHRPVAPIVVEITNKEDE